MLPTVVAREVMEAVRLQLHAQFPSTTQGFLRDDALAGARAAIDDLLDEPRQVFRGPYLNIGLPFQEAATEEVLPFSHLTFPSGYRSYRHQMKAFSRLCGGAAQPTLVATGTGSGKTECFLYPLLEHCAENPVPGIKALVIYPMNALAKDQARRFAKEVFGQKELKGKLRVGLYTGEASRGTRSMSEFEVITDRNTLQDDPPDILLTNYKMLDFLLIRPRDQKLWRHNTPGMLKYLVVDELHTFDGAQGSDLACLIRRLRDRLSCGEELACVGTSATVGDDAGALTEYASTVFATRFGPDSVLREEREDLDVFLKDEVSEYWPDRDSVQEFSQQHATQVEVYLQAASQLWLGKALPDVQEIGPELLKLAPFRNLLKQAVDVAELSDLADEHAQRWRVSKQEAANAIDGLVALACAARKGERPWLTVRVQLWLRELRRMVASVSSNPQLHFHADLSKDEVTVDSSEDNDTTIVLPVVHCNECHSTGWLARQPGGSAKLDREPLPIYESFFGNKPVTVALYDAKTPPESRKYQSRRLCSHCGTLSRMPREANELDAKTFNCGECGKPNATFVDVVLPEMTREVDRQGVKRVEFKRDCPYCEAQGSLLILGARAASLSSVAIGQLQQSPFNGDQKLIAFSDSVQDAAHRAGFFTARTYQSVIRHALATTIRHSSTGTLNELLDNFGIFWRNHLSKPELLPKASADADFVATFLAPDQYWRQDWDELRSSDRLSPSSDLVQNYVLPRLRWEALVAFGFESRRGRTLERTEVAVVHPETTRIDAAIDWAHPRIVEQLAELASLDTAVLKQLMLGVLWTLRTRGAFHDSMIDSFVHSNGRPFELTNRHLRTHLKPLGTQSRVPHFVALQHVGSHVDAVESSRAQSWYRRWFDKLAGQDNVLASAALSPFYRLLFDGMTRAGLLLRHEFQQHVVWSLDAQAWWVSTDVVTVACSDCRHRVQIARSDVADWEGMPCIRPSCQGVHAQQARLDGRTEPQMVEGEIVTPVRVNAAEHTAVLESDTRNATELSFKRNPAERWDVNLLSATPTMEMGVDIGDLSSVLLCSVPPAQANYLQRIGRAGRKDGNAFNLTIANGQPHDLYHFAEPLEMMRGAVQPPGVFLKAIAVLERQLVAFCFDRWVQTGIDDNAIPAQLRTVLDAVDAGSNNIFPNNLFTFINGERSRILQDFQNIFEAYLSNSGRNELSDFLQGAYSADGSKPGLVIRLQNLFAEQSDQRRRFQREIKALKAELDRIRRQPVDEAQKTAEAEVSAELSALRNLLSRLNRQNTLQFLTDRGVLPNYAFPEDGVTLKSVIYRRVSSAESTEGVKYQNIELEVRRPAQTALKELAPFSRFYGNTRSVQIDQVTIGRHDIELWRLCPSCNHGESIAQGDTHEVCPRCSHAGWRAAEQRMELMRLREVHARSSDRDSRIGDDSDDREPVFYNRQFLFDVDTNKIERGWRFTDENCPFGFEYLSRATFREVNFGRSVDGGSVVEVAGNACNRPGFPICAECGKVRMWKPKGQSSHARRCRWFGMDGDVEELAAWKHLHLFRELQSEAVRLLLPVADIARSALRLESFTAALHMGLREQFSGNVDHLQIKAIDEPVKGSDLRRYYLVIFDSVPGGTGYLAELLNKPESMRAMLEAAKRVLDDCACQHDAERDGCYRCLLAYKSSHQQADIKRSSALETLELILSAWESLQPLGKDENLEHTKVNRFFDSELERRFIDVLANSPGCTMERREVNGKDGYELTVRRAGVDAQTRASLRWSIELQVDLGEREGVAVPCRPDFLFRCLSTRDGQTRPIAVFADGFEYHAEIQDQDTAKRYAILRSGRYRVWTFGWKDIPAEDEQREYELGGWFPQAPERFIIDKLYDPAAKELGIGSFSVQPFETRAPVFVQWLHVLADPIVAECEYTTWAMSRAFGLLDYEASKTPEVLQQRLGTWLPTAWQELYLEGDQMLGHREFDGQPLVDAVVSLPKSALKTLTEVVRAAKIQPVSTRDPMSPEHDTTVLREVAEETSISLTGRTAVHPLSHLPLSLVLRLDDTHPAGDEYRLQWRRFWAAVNLLQYLPEMMLVSRSGIEKRVYAPIIEDSDFLGESSQSVPESDLDRAWLDMIEFSEEPAALTELSRRGIEPPDEVGIDVEEDDEVLGSLEWCWAERRVGLIFGKSEDATLKLRSKGWRIVEDVEPASLDAIVNWLLEN